MISYIVGALAIACYGGGAILQYLNLTRSENSPRNGVIVLGATALLLHLLSFNGTLYVQQTLDPGIHNMISLITWLVAALALFGSIKMPLRNVLIGIYPLAAAGLLLALATGDQAIARPLIAPNIATHILLSLISYSVLTIAAVQAVLLAIQDHHLRHQLVGGLVMHLPPLQLMEQILFQLIWVGVLFLTTSILSGVIFIEDVFAQHLAHKTLLSIFAWVIFSTLLLGRYRLGWRGTLAIRFTIGGYLLLMLAYFGTKMVLEIIL